MCPTYRSVQGHWLQQGHKVPSGLRQACDRMSHLTLNIMRIQYECLFAMICWRHAGGNSMGRLWYCLLTDLPPGFALSTAKLQGYSHAKTLCCLGYVCETYVSKTSGVARGGLEGL